VLFGSVLWAHTRRYRKLWEEGVRLCGDRAELERQLADQKKTRETVREAAMPNERVKSAFISNSATSCARPERHHRNGAASRTQRSRQRAARSRQVLLESSRGLKTLLDDIIALSQHSDEPLTAPEEGCDVGQAARTVVRLLQAQCVGKAPAAVHQCGVGLAARRGRPAPLEARAC
jgi:hypothetical protein